MDTDKPDYNSIEQNQDSCNASKEQLFDISFKEKLFSIEISTGKKEEMEFISLKGYEKSNVSKYIYFSTYTSKQLIEMGKAFKVCDDFSEIFAMILQKFEDREVKLVLDEDLCLNIEFILPNKKAEKINLILKKEKIKDSELIMKLLENISFLQEKNKSLQEQMTKLVTKKKPKSFIDIISNKFKMANVLLLNGLCVSLEKFDLKDEYMKELLDIFQTKTKTIYNFKKDEDTIQSFISKVFGKKNLAGYFSCYKKDGEKYEFEANFGYLDGKLEFENGYLTFVTKGVFTFGTYCRRGEVDFCHFRNDEAKIYIKIEQNFVYLIIYKSSNSIRCIFKINNHFRKYPINLLNLNSSNYNNDESINKLESLLKKEKENKEKEKGKEKDKNNEKLETNENDNIKGDEIKKEDDFTGLYEYYLKELKVYQIDNQ